MISIKTARRAGVPLLVVETADPQQTISTIIAEINGKQADSPIMRWDICRALIGLNEAGSAIVNEITNGEAATTTQNPTECLSVLQRSPESSFVFFLNAQLFWGNETVRQAIWNLRDTFKSIGAMLILLCQSAFGLPDELKNDCIVLTDSLPNVEEVNSIIESLLKDAGLDAKKIGDKEKIADTLLGLPAFTAEQVLAMSVNKEGVDRSALWERKRQMIEQTPGLSVWRGGETFKDIGGYENAKKFMKAICNGRAAPRAVVFIDEIEKSLAGSQTDSSGVSQDYLRCLLTWMQDKEASGTIFVGPAGSGKSAIAKATGNEANIPTIALDLGGMKGSLVGESEKRLRTALQVVEAISQGAVLFIATCNSMSILPPELRRRFSLGTFFFPLPSASDRSRIWDIYLGKLKIPRQELPDNQGWTGAEIKNCVTIAWRLKCSLAEAAKFIVPVSVSARDQIEKLCREAHTRYISASQSGIYKWDEMTPSEKSGRRLIQEAKAND